MIKLWTKHCYSVIKLKRNVKTSPEFYDCFDFPGNFPWIKVVKTKVLYQARKSIFYRLHRLWPIHTARPRCKYAWQKGEKREVFLSTVENTFDFPCGENVYKDKTIDCLCMPLKVICTNITRGIDNKTFLVKQRFSGRPHISYLLDKSPLIYTDQSCFSHLKFWNWKWSVYFTTS